MLMRPKGSKSNESKKILHVEDSHSQIATSFVSPDKFDPRTYTYVTNVSIPLEVD